MSKPDFTCLPDKGIWRQNFLRIFQDGRHNQYELFVSVIFFNTYYRYWCQISRNDTRNQDICIWKPKKILDLFFGRKNKKIQ